MTIEPIREGMKSDKSLSELFPEGRFFYFEGEDPTGFFEDLRSRGIEYDVSISFHCPPDLLDEMTSKYRLGT
jgi:hypothetical protein